MGAPAKELFRAAPLCALVLFADPGCAARAKTVTLDVQATHPVSVAPIEMEPWASKLTAVGTYRVGRYDDNDLRVLHEMLEEAIPVRGAPEDSLRIHLVVREFLVAHSNNNAAAIACVAWALTNPRGELVFDEQFYASRRTPPLSISGIKNRIHEGITKRVHHRAQDVASGRPLGPQPEDTYDDFERAASRVPDWMASHFSVWEGRYFSIERTVAGEPGETVVRRNDYINWYDRLGIPKPADEPYPGASPEAPPSTTPLPPGYPRSTGP